MELTKRRAWGLLLLIGGSAFGLSCGSNSNQSPSIPLVPFILLGGDKPACNISSFRMTLRAATLTPQPSSGGTVGTPIPLLLAGQSATLDFASLQDFSTLINNVEIPEGTYSQLTLTLANPQLYVVNYNTSPASVVPVTAQLTTASVTLPLNPPLSVTTTGLVAMSLDLDLPSSIQTDASGAVTGVITPTFSVTQVPTSGASSLGELENIHGVVQSVSTTGASSTYAGGLVVLPPGPGFSPTSVNTNSTTVFTGATGISELALNTFVEVDGFVDTSGNIVARTVQSEGVENPGQFVAAFLGPIVSVTSSSGNVTQFTMFVREESPDVTDTLPTGQLLNVTLSSGTTVSAEATATNFDQLTASAGTLTPGQEVVAHGVFTVNPNAGTVPVLSATAVYLREQTLSGTFSSLLAAGSDDQTGGFAFLPCTNAFGGNSLPVVTNAQTNFLGVSGLNSLTTSKTLLVKGLLLFEPTLTSAGTVPLTPPSYLFSSNQVHQLP